MPLRSVPDQEPEEIAGPVKASLESFCPPDATPEVKYFHGRPVVLDASSKVVQATLWAIGQAHCGTEVAFIRSAGLIPVWS